MIGSIRQDNKGYTLMELIVAIGIFVVAIMMIMGIYTYASKGLSVTTKSQKTLSSIRFDIETIAQNIRTSEIDYTQTYDFSDELGIVDDEPELHLTANSGADTIHYWFDSANNSIKYWLNSDTPIDLTDTANISVENLKFYITPALDPYTLQPDISYLSDQQPKVTIVAEFKSKGGKENEIETIFIQTTISTRVYKR